MPSSSSAIYVNTDLPHREHCAVGNDAFLGICRGVGTELQITLLCVKFDALLLRGLGRYVSRDGARR